MNRPPLEVADLVRAAGRAFIEHSRRWITWQHLTVLRAIARCRTAALGGHLDECVDCGYRPAISYNSCRNRHCPKCQANARARWLQARRQELLPHVHCVVPAGGLSLDRTHWIQPRYPFFLPVKVLSRVFRGKFVATLKRNFRQGKLGFHGHLKPLAHPKVFFAWIRTLFRNDWHVYSKRPFGGAEHALCYLGHYTHRVAISNHRLVSLAEDQVTFRWRDSAHHNEHKLMTLALDEFLRRFLLHLLPKGFVRIRHFGFLANRRRTALLPLCYRLLDAEQPSQSKPTAALAKQSNPLWRCPKCGGPMVVIERLSAAQLQLRSPPFLIGAAA